MSDIPVSPHLDIPYPRPEKRLTVARSIVRAGGYVGRTHEQDRLERQVAVGLRHFDRREAVHIIRIPIIEVLIVELMLPESYLQKRTITMNYTVFRHIYYDRYYKPHKMLEWRQFCEQMLDKLSYVEFVDEKLKLAEERNDLLSKLGELNIEKFHLEREVKKLNEKLNGEAEG